jgi:hypothetical protein
MEVSTQSNFIATVQHISEDYWGAGVDAAINSFGGHREPTMQFVSRETLED